MLDHKQDHLIVKCGCRRCLNIKMHFTNLSLPYQIHLRYLLFWKAKLPLSLNTENFLQPQEAGIWSDIDIKKYLVDSKNI